MLWFRALLQALIANHCFVPTWNLTLLPNPPRKTSTNPAAVLQLSPALMAQTQVFIQAEIADI